MARRRRRFSDLAPEIVAATSKALYREANEIMNDSQELVPVDTGTLKASGRVLEPVQHVDGTVEVRAGYGYGEETNPLTGQPASGYAVYVHEILDAKHEPPTSAKFLERPALEHKKTFAGRIAVEIREVLRNRRVA